MIVKGLQLIGTIVISIQMGKFAFAGAMGFTLMALDIIEKVF